MKLKNFKIITLSFWIFFIIISSSFIYYLLIRAEDQKISQIIKQKTEIAISSLCSEFKRYESSLKSAALFIQSSEHVSKAEFSDFANGIIKNTSGMQALEWAPRVSDNERSEFEKKLQKIFPDFKIKEISTWPNLKNSENKNVYYPVKYSEPYQKNEIVIGYDHNSDKNHSKIIEEAYKEKKIKMSFAFKLFRNKDVNAPLAYLIFQPVLDGDKEEVIGFVIGVFKFVDLVKNIERVLDKENLSYLVTTYSKNDQNSKVLYSSEKLDDSLEAKKKKYILSFINTKLNLFITPKASFYSFYRSYYPSVVTLFYIIVNLVLLYLFKTLFEKNLEIQETVNIKTKELLELNLDLKSKEKNLDLLVKTRTEELEKSEEALLNAMQDLKEKNKNIEEMASELNFIFNNMPVKIWFKDEHNKILRLNKAAANSMGGEVSDFEGKNTYDLFPEMAKKYHEDDLKVINSGEGLYGIIEEFTPLDGEKSWVLTDKIPADLIAYNSKVILVASTDITDRMKAEHELIQNSEKLKKSNRELEQFAYIASHDLQEPLRMVSSFSQILNEKYRNNLDEDGVKYLDYLVKGATRMQYLIKDLLKFSKVTSSELNYENINGEVLLRSIIDDLQMKITEEKAEIEFDNLANFNADLIQIRRVFQNLISNSLKFRDQSKALKIKITSNKIDGFVEFRVKDNGIGIKEKYFEKVFVIFQRLHTPDEYEGTGLGLAITKKIIERHKGEIEISSKFEEGTEVIFRLPN